MRSASIVTLRSHSSARNRGDHAESSPLLANNLPAHWGGGGAVFLQLIWPAHSHVRFAAVVGWPFDRGTICHRPTAAQNDIGRDNSFSIE